MIHEEIVTYEVAKLAKEKGFGEGCLHQYTEEGFLEEHYAYDATNSGVGVNDLLWHQVREGNILAPTQSLLQIWLREEKFIDFAIYPIFINGVRIYTCYAYAPKLNKPKKFNYFDTYELALEDALKYALENLV